MRWRLRGRGGMLGRAPIEPWGSSATLGALDGTRIDELYRSQAAQRPGAVAVICGGEQLTFAALAARTGALAARLRALGVTAERRVALAVSRSLDLAVGTLAIVEAGGAFVPIDPRAGGGAERIAGLVRAAGAELLVTQEALRPAIGDPGVPVVALDRGPDNPAVARPAEPLRGAGPTSESSSRLLYVIHTSGSTAAPRPVEVEHASAVDQVHSLARDLGLGSGDRHLHTASLGFTLAIRQLLLPICLGGAVVIAREDELGKPLALIRAARRTGVTVLDLVPSVLRAVVAALRALPPDERAAAIPERLRLVLTAGERLPPEVVADWWSLAGTAARVINLYGASEVGGSVAWHEVRARDVARSSIPIGRVRSGTVIELFEPSVGPLLGPAVGVSSGASAGAAFRVSGGAALGPSGGAFGGTSVPTIESSSGSSVEWSAGSRVEPSFGPQVESSVGPFRAPVDVGAIGELCVAGPAVARGYAGSVESDRTRFVVDPVRGVRWARTGDLARLGEDGALELIGRLDEEVKIRGVRVQPEVVEAVLRAAAGAPEAEIDAAVVATGEPPRLVAYLEGPALLADAALRAHVRRVLPAAFVPALFVRVAALPRLASGKLDRSALRARAAGAALAATVPASELEQRVARQWAAQLGIAPGDAGGDFFALGGSSLDAVELASRLGEAFGHSLRDPVGGSVGHSLAVPVPASLVFERPTVAEQAAWLAERLARGSPSDAALPRLAHMARTGMLALSFAQERMWLGEALTGGERAQRVHRGLVLSGALDQARLEAAMRTVADRHEALRTTFAAAAGRPHQVVHAALPRDHAILDLSGRGPGELARLQAEARSHAFDLERGPLWRTRLVRIAPDRHALLLTIHHLVTDGWSMRCWLAEVSALYAAPNGVAAALPELVVQPADVADWQRRCLASGAYDGAAAYWRAQLAGAAVRPELPHDGPRHDAIGDWIEGELAAPAVAALRELALAEACTLFMVLLAALAELVAELTGERDVAIGALVAGRDRAELRPLIGLFLNALPLRVRAGHGSGLRGTLASAREATLGALAHAELPFERIVAELNPPRQPRRNPLFDVVLNDLPPASGQALGDLEVGSLDSGLEVGAPFDAMWRVVADDDRLRLRVEYRRGRFAGPRIRQWLARYLDLLARAAAG